MKRILLPDGKFANFKPADVKKAQAKKVLEKTLEDDENFKKEDIIKTSSNEESNESNEIEPCFVLTGEETNKELKSMLDEVKVSYSKTANKNKLLELIDPYVDHKSEDVSDL